MPKVARKTLSTAAMTRTVLLRPSRTYVRILASTVSHHWVESRMGAVRDLLAVVRFPSPLIKPDVRIARIRLSDWFHLKAVGGAPMWTWRSRRTPNSP